MYNAPVIQVKIQDWFFEINNYNRAPKAKLLAYESITLTVRLFRLGFQISQLFSTIRETALHLQNVSCNVPDQSDRCLRSLISTKVSVSSLHVYILLQIKSPPQNKDLWDITQQGSKYDIHGYYSIKSCNQVPMLYSKALISHFCYTS